VLWEGTEISQIEVAGALPLCRLVESFQYYRMLFVSVADPLSSWSADECANFVSGLRQYGKDFYQIHQNKVLKVLSTFTCPIYQNCFGVVFDLRM